MQDNQPDLNIDALTPSRQTLLTGALAGHAVDISNGEFTPNTLESLAKIGLTPIEITALKTANANHVTGALRITAGAGSDNNPFSKDKWNPELQRQLHDKNPAECRRLMKEAKL